MNNVINFNRFTKNDIEPNKVLDGAKDILDTVLIIGRNSNNSDFYFATSHTDIAELLLYIETFKFKLMNGDFY